MDLQNFVNRTEIQQTQKYEPKRLRRTISSSRRTCSPDVNTGTVMGIGGRRKRGAPAPHVSFIDGSSEEDVRFSRLSNFQTQTTNPNIPKHQCNIMKRDRGLKTPPRYDRRKKRVLPPPHQHCSSNIVFQLGSSDDDTKTKRVIPDCYYEAANLAVATKNDPSLTDFQFSLTKIYPTSKELLNVLKEQLDAVIKEANAGAKCTSLNTYKSINEITVDHLFYLCEQLHVNVATKFRALELYDKFVVRFNEEIRGSIRNSESSDSDSIRERIVSQCPLRMCTCIHIAAKLHADLTNSCLTSGKLKQLLTKCGYSYKKEAILRSEIRVMTTLNFRFQWITPFEIVESLVGILCVDITLMPKMYHFAMVFLEWSYISHHCIYRKFRNICRSKYPANSVYIKSSLDQEEDDSSELFKRTIEFNLILRSAAIVNAAALTVFHTLKSPVTAKIADITHIPLSLIEDLSYLLMDLLINAP